MNLSKCMNDGLKRSFRVLKNVRIAKNTPDDRISVGAYVNGREHGLRINVYTTGFADVRTLIICENRNSDDMILYEGDFREFDINGLPSEQRYEERTYFASEKNLTKALAKAISKILKTKKVKEAA